MAATTSPTAVSALEQRSGPRPSTLEAPMPVTASTSCVALRTAVTGLTRLDDFDLELIGSGFFANVYKVRHLVTDEIMVLKLAKSGRSQAMYRSDSNSLREVQIMKSLSHPKILRFFGVCVHEGQLHPLVEFINGGALEELLLDHTKAVAWPLRFKLSLDIAEGMAYLHSRGMFHRDLTSKNVLLRMEGDQMEAVVADFGLAAKIPCVTGAPLSVVGTPYWMAPEVLNGETYNEKADVFSYGIILCEILTRVGADPENLPRTNSFGLNVSEFKDMVAGSPPVLVRLAIHCCQLAPERRLTFAQITAMLSRHRGHNLHNENTSRILIVEESGSGGGGGSSSDVSAGVSDLNLSGHSPCCSPEPTLSLLSSNSSSEILQCLSPPCRTTSVPMQLPSPLEDPESQVDCTDGGGDDDSLQPGPGRHARDLLEEYCSAKSDRGIAASPESLSSASVVCEHDGSPSFLFPPARDVMEHLVSTASIGASPPAIVLSPSPPRGDPCVLASSSPILLSADGDSEAGVMAQGTPLTEMSRASSSDFAGGKSPRPPAAWRAKHQRSASLSKYLTRPFPCLADQMPSSMPSSPTSSRSAVKPPQNFLAARVKLYGEGRPRPKSATPTMDDRL